MKTHIHLSLSVLLFLLGTPGCEDRKAEKAEAVKQAEIERKTLLKRADEEAVKAREAASKGTVPQPKPVEDPFLK